MKTAVFAIAGIAFASLVAIGSTPAAAAEAYPAKPIHMMLGFDPGASSVSQTGKSAGKPD